MPPRHDFHVNFPASSGVGLGGDIFFCPQTWGTAQIAIRYPPAFKGGNGKFVINEGLNGKNAEMLDVPLLCDYPRVYNKNSDEKLIGFGGFCNMFGQSVL